MWQPLFSSILDLIFPRSCLGCDQNGTYCCRECFAGIPRLTEHLLSTPETPSSRASNPSASALKGIFAAIRHEEHSLSAELIYGLKYDGIGEMSEPLGRLMAERLATDALFSELCAGPMPPILIPVPLHRRRQNMRGFNQSEFLAHQLQKHLELGIDRALTRHRYTSPQVELKRGERLENLQGAFSLTKGHPQLDPSIPYLLVDDVTTTGSTLRECAQVLKKNGAENIFGVVVAHAE